MLNIRQLAAFVGVLEEGSFSKAARRLNATQSGLSMQVQNLEERTGLVLFERSPRGVVPTVAAMRLYERALGILRELDETEAEIRTLSKGVSGAIRVGLMPTFTRGVMVSALADFIASYPNVDVSIMEAYSAVLTEEVLSGAIDFAIVPRAVYPPGLRTRWLGTDREMLVRRAGSEGPEHLAPVRLASLGPLQLVLPSGGNARRAAFDAYAQLHGIRIARLVTMDAMIATLEFVAATDFATILPETICLNDRPGDQRWLNPIVSPDLTVDYAVIQPAKSGLTAAAERFLDAIERAYRLSRAVWEEAGPTERQAGYQVT